MIRETEEYINEYGKTDDIILGILMFWVITTHKNRRFNLDYFNEKLDRFLDTEATEEQMNRYETEMNIRIDDKNLTVESMKKVIDIITDIFGVNDVEYQLHMYGSADDGSGDFWIKGKESVMEQFDKEGGIFSIIASSNGVSIVEAEKVNFLDANDMKELNRHFNINRILE